MNEQKGIAKSLVCKCDEGSSPGRGEEVAKGSQLAGRTEDVFSFTTCYGWCWQRFLEN